MNHTVRMLRLESLLAARNQTGELYARFGITPATDPATITDPAQRAGLTMIRSLAGQPGGAVLLGRYFDALGDFGREEGRS